MQMEKKVISIQTGVVRTNCIDNLDRTNVVQGLVGRHVLKALLAKFNIITSGSEALFPKPFEQTFKTVWANSGDAISLIYSGTRALKGDFTRTGKRNLLGIINDGVNSIMRYYLNNFADGFRQDAFDLFVGNYRIQNSVDIKFVSPFIKKRNEKRNLYVITFALAAIMFLMSILAPSEFSYLSKLLYVLFWFFGLFVVWRFFLNSGKIFVDKPSLLVEH